MSVSNPTSYQIVLTVDAAKYEELLKEAQATNHSSIESYLLAAGRPAPKMVPADTVFHSVPDEKTSGKK